MPPRSIGFRDARRRLLAAGFLEVGTEGSHVKFVKRTQDGLRTVIVPRHREIAVGTLHSVLRQAGISIGEGEAL
jgi:predicted RNA binding protein YcfA (HicA-like mRNA interferase family)